MNSLVDNIYVINMKKDVERLNKFQQQCDDLFKYEIIEGVDVCSDKYKIFYDSWKKNLNESISYDTFDWIYYINRYEDLKGAGINDKKTAWEHYINHGKKELRSCNLNCDIVHPGQLGCLLSHANILKNAIYKKYKSILILEDDIIISKNFFTRINEIKQIANDGKWSIIYLGAGQHEWSKINIHDNFYVANKSTGTFAYMVHESFYQILLNTFEKMKKPVDNYLIELQKCNDFKVVYPNMIFCDLEHSNISTKRINKEWFKKFKWDNII